MLREFTIGCKAFPLYSELAFTNHHRRWPEALNVKTLFWAGIRWPMGSRFQHRYQPQSPAIAIISWLPHYKDKFRTSVKRQEKATMTKGKQKEERLTDLCQHTWFWILTTLGPDFPLSWAKSYLATTHQQKGLQTFWKGTWPPGLTQYKHHSACCNIGLRIDAGHPSQPCFQGVYHISPGKTKSGAPGPPFPVGLTAQKSRVPIAGSTTATRYANGKR